MHAFERRDRSQPPGGASAFRFDDGSTTRYRQPPEQERRGHAAIEPAGGRSTFAFDDYAGQEDAYLGRPMPRQRHTQKGHFNTQPPGGHASHSFADGSQRGAAAVCHAGDAAVDRSALKEHAHQQPPGGRASFSFDDGPTARIERGAGAGLLQPPGGRSSLSLHDGVLSQPSPRCPPASQKADDASLLSAWQAPTRSRPSCTSSRARAGRRAAPA